MIALNLGRPVVGLGTWRISADDGVEDERILRADDAAQAVELAVAAAEEV